MTDTTPRLYRDTDGDWWAATADGNLVCLTDADLDTGAPHAHVDRMYGPLTHVPLADAAEIAQLRERYAALEAAHDASLREAPAIWARIRRCALTEAAALVDQTAAEMRAAEGPWPEEWSSRDIRDAVEAAAGRIRDALTTAPATTTEPDQ